MGYYECNCLERKAAYHVAPVLLGIKPAGLFSVLRREANDSEIEKFNRQAAKKGLTMRIMCMCNERTLIMLYNKKSLAEQLRSEKNAALLSHYGYSNSMPLENILERLASRITLGDDFPHEIGIFLGYPLEDVCGFIENSGQNFKLCGYWKVYGDIEKARRTFENYDKCRKFLCNKLYQGADIYQALKIS